MTIQNFMQLTQKTALLSYSLSNLLTEADSSKAPTFEESSCNPTASGPIGEYKHWVCKCISNKRKPTLLP